MKRCIIGLLTLWLLLCAHASAEWATVCNANPSDRLNLRAEASSEAISYGKYYNGTQVELLSGPKNGWYRVRVGAGNGVCDVEGYMLAKYLAVGNAACAVRDARPRVTLSSSSGSVLLRDFHSGSCVGKVQSGTQVTVLGVGTKYLHVLTDDGTCGMALLDCATPRLEFRSENASAKWATVCNANPSDRLNLRAEASSEAISYGKYYNGTQVELLSGPKNGWYRVRVGAGNGVCDVEGYMLAKYLAVGNAACAVRDARPRVTLSSSSGSVLLRDFHSGSCVGKVQSGTQVTALGVGTKYLHVLTDDGTCGMALLDCATPRLEF